MDDFVGEFLLFILKVAWYSIVLAFWIMVLIGWALFAGARGIYNLATRESFSKGIRAPKPKFR